MNEKQSICDVDKHAYLIVSNGNLKVLYSCLQLIDDLRNDIYVIFDKKAKIKIENIKEKAQIKSSDLFLLPCVTVNWGVFAS